jgi:hypothetical protein
LKFKDRIPKINIGIKTKTGCSTKVSRTAPESSVILKLQPTTCPK